MDNTKQEIEMVTLRRAADFGTKLAVDLAEKLQKENIDVFKWPEHFPITLKKISLLPEIDKNNKVAKRVSEAAIAVWREIRSEAVMIETVMLANPDYHDHPQNQDKQEWSWRELFMEIEQASGSLFLTEQSDEDMAKKNVYGLLKPAKLKNYMKEFEDDYKNFINEIRENIRAKKTISASTRLELICMLNTNTQAAIKLAQKQKKS